MSDKIDEIEGIGPAYMEKLNQAEINSTDDLGDPDSGHAILSQSTESIDGIVISGTQATYDLQDWIDVVFGPQYSEDYNAIMQTIADEGGFDTEISEMYGLAPGVDPVDALTSDPDVVAYREICDMLDLLDGNDAPPEGLLDLR